MKEILLSFVQDFLKNNRIPTYIITPPCDAMEWLDCGLRADIMPDIKPDFVPGFLDTLKENTIYHLIDAFQCSYSVFRVPDSNALLLCGPVIFERMRVSRIKSIAAKVQLPQELYTVLQSYYLRIAFFSAPAVYYSIFMTLGNHLFGENQYETVYQNINDIDEWYESYSRNYRNVEDSTMAVEMIEMRYALEAQLLDAVFCGNEAKAMALVPQFASLSLPRRLPDELRDCKDYTIAINTLLRKKAEEAGVHPLHIDACSNQHVQLIEEIISKEQSHAVCARMVLDYCRLICKYAARNYSPLTQRTIAYINSDLTANLSLKTISEWLNVNASYLSTLFKREVGITLTDFVNQQRIEQAKKLLIVTDLPIKMIAQQCGISDIYYFSRIFKKRIGSTPKFYRENAVMDRSMHGS